MNVFRGTFRATALACVLAISAVPAWAHRVNIFAYVEGDKIMVDCSYSKSKRVNHGAITVKDAKTGAVLITGETDEQGRFSFTVPEEAKARRADLVIHLTAGEGHDNEWEVKADEYLSQGAEAAAAPVPDKKGDQAAQPVATASQTPEKQASSLAAPVTAPVAGPGTATAMASGGTCDEAAIAKAVEAAVETKIAPIRRILIEEKEGGPKMTEIVGGIGWIFGLIGMAAYFRSRKTK